MYPHRMHLKGPWQYEWLERSSEETSGSAGLPSGASDLSGRVKLPAEWRTLFGDIAGKVRFRRRFHRPTNLEPHEHVFLIFDGIGGVADITLNGERLGSIASTGSADTAEFEITGRLELSNELAVDLRFGPRADTTGPPGGLWGAVALEIRAGTMNNIPPAHPLIDDFYR